MAKKSCLARFCRSGDNTHHNSITGSANESASALLDNFECVDVFCYWDEGVRERTLSKAENFRRLWENETPMLELLQISNIGVIN